MNPRSRWLVPAAFCVTLGLSGTAAQAASWTDFLFGSKSGQPEKTASSTDRRIWRIGEFTAIQRADKEAGAAANQQPAVIAPESLRLLLAPARLVNGQANVPLFHPEELNDLIEPLSEALAAAGTGDDLLLLSTHRRGEGILRTPSGLTARLFVQGDALNLIVHDARRDFVNAYIGSRIPPTFTFGSRATPSPVTLAYPGATVKRADWLVIPVQRAAAPVAAPAPAPVVLPPAAPVQAVPAPAIFRASASTLSSDIERSARMIVQRAAQNVVSFG